MNLENKDLYSDHIRYLRGICSLRPVFHIFFFFSTESSLFEFTVCVFQLLVTKNVHCHCLSLNQPSFVGKQTNKQN